MNINIDVDAELDRIRRERHAREGRTNGHDFNGKSAKASTTQAAALRLKKFDPIKYIVPGYIVEGCTLLAGRPKLGKSWLMLDIALAVAAGRYCLGDTKCEQGDVLYLALEDNERRLQSRITKILGFANEWPGGLTYATEWPRADAGGLDEVRKWIASAKQPRLVVVDILAMFRSPRRKDQQPYEADYEAIKGLQAIASETNVAIVIVHHLRKSGAESGDPFEKVSGTLGLSGGADTVLVLDRDGQGCTLYGRGRDIEELEKAVTFNKATCRWTVMGEAVEVRRTDERSVILDVLKDADEPMSPKDIMVAAELTNRNAVDILLYKMAKAGEVEKVGRGLYLYPGKVHPPGKNGKKERSESQPSVVAGLNSQSVHLSNLSGGDEGADEDPDLFAKDEWDLKTLKQLAHAKRVTAQVGHVKIDSGSDPEDKPRPMPEHRRKVIQRLWPRLSPNDQRTLAEWAQFNNILSH